MNFVNFEIILYSTLCALALGPLNSALAERIGLVDIPGREPHKKGNRRVPLAGGPVLVETLLIVGLATGAAVVSDAWRILAASGIVFVFGLWDDFRPLPPLVKLAGQVLASIALLMLGISVTLFGSPVLNVAVTILWMVTLTNAFNFVDSMDGLAAGLAALASAFFMLVSASTSQPRLAEFGALLLGSCVGCLYLNSHPARFFLGDSGAQLLGFILAGLAIAYNPPGFSPYVSWFVPILLLAVPIFDMALVVYARLSVRRPVYQAGLDHTYHRLVALGMSSERAVLTMQMVGGLLGCLAFVALALPDAWANAIFFVVVALGVVLMLWLVRRTNNEAREIPEKRGISKEVMARKGDTRKREDERVA